MHRKFQLTLHIWQKYYLLLAIIFALLELSPVNKKIFLIFSYHFVGDHFVGDHFGGDYFGGDHFVGLRRPLGVGQLGVTNILELRMAVVPSSPSLSKQVRHFRFIFTARVARGKNKQKMPKMPKLPRTSTPGERKALRSHLVNIG